MYIPSQEMGGYEEKRHRKKSSGVLYPLDEEGSYGRPPSQSSRAPPPQPAFPKRERKPKVYASYAVSSDCSMHASKLEKNENTANRRDNPPRGRPNIQRNNSFRTKPSPTRSRDSTTPNTPKNTLRDTSYTHNAPRWQESLRGADNSAPRWQDSLRGRDSVSPSTPRVQRRCSTQPRRTPRETSSSVSPNRSRNISTSPDRQRKMQSPDQRRRRSGDHSGRSSVERGGPRRSSVERKGPRRSSVERGEPRSSTDWGYTNFSTFTANRKSVDNSSSGIGVRKVSDDRKSSTASQRKGSSSGRRPSSGRDNISQDRRASANESFREFAGGDDYSARNDYSAGRDYSARNDYSVSVSRDYSGSMSRDNQFGSGSRSASPSKVGLSTLKTPTLTDWDNMGILGLSSKMFNDSTSFKESYVSSSASSFRRESVSTKVM